MKSALSDFDRHINLVRMTRRIRMVNICMVLLFAIIGGFLIGAWRYPVTVQHALAGGRRINGQVLFDVPARLAGRIHEGQIALIQVNQGANILTGRVEAVTPGGGGLVCQVLIEPGQQVATTQPLEKCRVIARQRTVGDIILNR